MGVNKEHKEFHAVDMSTGWETPVGYPAGIQQKILIDELTTSGFQMEKIVDDWPANNYCVVFVKK